MIFNLFHRQQSISIQIIMVKFSNKGKGAPSHRTNFKTKYKIERKVKQHRKKLKKQAKKLTSNGLKHKRISKSQFMPNMFPFKQQILQQLRSSLPKQQQATITQLSAQQYGLINLQNKPIYFPKPRDNLIKKYVSNLDKVFQTCNVMIQVLEARSPFLSIDAQFRKQCQSKNIKRVTVVSKIDSVKQPRLQVAMNQLKKNGDIVLKFTTDSKQRVELIQQIRKAIKQVAGKSEAVICIAGKANTGKHTLLHQICKQAGKYQETSCELFEISLGDGVKIIDAPYKIEDKTQFPLFYTPNPLKTEESLIAQEQLVLKLLFFQGDLTFKGPILNRNASLIHYEIQDFTSVDDLIKKVGKVNRIFGKGGMVDLAAVRSKMLTEWYTGKLNSLINDAKLV